MSTVCYRDNFIANVKAALEKRGWSQRELARQSGLHWQTIRRILADEMNPSVDVCETIAETLELKPEKVFRSPT